MVGIFKINVTFLLLICLVACGGGGAPAASAPASASASANVVSSATTSAIQANMTMNYDNEQLTLHGSIQNCFRQFGAGSGQAIICGVNVKSASVQNFLNVVLANIRTVKNNTPIDKTTIVAMLNSYKARDLRWLTTDPFSPAITMDKWSLDAAAAIYDPSVNTSYSNALIQLNGM